MTIFISIYDSLLANNMLRTDVIPTLLKRRSDLRVVIPVVKGRVEEYKKLFLSDHVIFVGVDVNPASAFEQKWVSFLTHTMTSETLTIQLFGGPVAPRRGIFKRVLTYILRFVFGNRPGRMILRAANLLMFRHEPYTELFQRYRPDIVFCTNVFAPLDVELLREAKRRSVPTIGMAKSWDNITSRGPIRQIPDKFITQTNLMREQLLTYDDVPPEKVTVCGVSQYDIYLRPDEEDRVAFWKRFGIDGTKKVILYLEPGLKLAPHGHEVWQILDDFIEKDLIKEPVEAFISVHPAYAYREDVARSLTYPKVIRFGYQLAGGSHKSWEISKDGYRNLMLSVRNADLVITTGSTMNIESSIFDKPIINIAFDGKQQLPYHKSVRVFYDYTHLIPIVRSGGVKVAYSTDELLTQINFLLSHPEWGREGRAQIVKDQCVYTDGKSAERVAGAILDFLAETKR